MLATAKGGDGRGLPLMARRRRAEVVNLARSVLRAGLRYFDP